jgi:hypothetical protein
LAPPVWDSHAKKEEAMLETLVEAVPFLVGGGLGWMIRDEFWIGRVPRSVQVAIASLLLGSFQTWIAGELTHDLLSSFGAILIDGSAVALGLVGARLLRAQIEVAGLWRRH